MPKKKKSKNITLPLLGISLFSMLGLTVYLNRPTPTPLRIAEVTAPVSNCATVSFTDKFAGTTLDSSKWFAYSKTGGTATVDNQLTLKIPANTTNGTSEIASQNLVEIEGDFIQEITVVSLESNPSTSKATSFAIGFVSDDWKNWYRLEVYKNGDIQTYATTDSVTTPSTAVNAYKDTPIKLKIVRAKSNLTTYYDVGQGYKIHTIFENIYTGKVWLQLITLSHAPELPAVTTILKDFSLRCRPPFPTGLSHSCSEDGKKVLLKWDDNSPGKYTFILNDTTNDVGNSIFTEGSTDSRSEDYDKNSYELGIIPGNKYEWFLRTNENGPGSDASDMSEKTFTCIPKISAPSNPRFNCNPDGKSVRLTWDGVVDVESYKVRLDDKNGKVTNYDNLKEPQHITTILPGKTYSFWVHSHKNDVDSNQSATIDFTCKASATPTPTPKPTVKPTVKPTIAPTPTPTLSPTLTPKASVYTPPVQRELTNLNDLNDNIETTKESELKPTNPVSKFFLWLANLFE